LGWNGLMGGDWWLAVGEGPVYYLVFRVLLISHPQCQNADNLLPFSRMTEGVPNPKSAFAAGKKQAP
jgi:hypothetical protein